MYTPKERTHAIMLYQSGLSLRAAAKEIGCTDTTVENWLRIEGSRAEKTAAAEMVTPKQSSGKPCKCSITA